MEALPPRLVGLLCAAILVALIARRLRLPYTVGLVGAGLCFAMVPGAAGIGLTRDLIFQLILPPLLFEAALQIHWHELRRDAPVVLALATLGVVIAAATVAAGLMLLLRWPPEAAVMFGVLIAATDPVAVIALFKDTGLTGRLRFLVETESLLNDGVAAVLFTLAYAWAAGGGAGSVSLAHAARVAVLDGGGGAALGLACGALATLIAGRTADHLVETALTLVAAYGAFYAAETLHASGVLATVAAGLVMGNFGVLREDGTMSSLGRRSVLGFWDFAAFLMNSLVFLLIGVAVGGLQVARLAPGRLAVIIALVLLGRALCVYPLCALFRGRLRVGLRLQHVLWWGGLRGALGLALALSLPANLPHHDDIVLATFAVVVFSVVVQGLTVSPLISALGLRGGVERAPP